MGFNFIMTTKFSLGEVDFKSGRSHNHTERAVVTLSVIRSSSLLTTASLIWSSLLLPIPILLLLLSPTDLVDAEYISSANASRFKRAKKCAKRRIVNDSTCKLHFQTLCMCKSNNLRQRPNNRQLFNALKP